VTNHAISGLLSPAQPSHVDFGFGEPLAALKASALSQLDCGLISSVAPGTSGSTHSRPNWLAPSAGSVEVIGRFVWLALLPFD
jgi:hypothetical protein